MSNVISIKNRLPLVEEKTVEEKIVVVEKKAKRKSNAGHKILVNSTQVAGLLVLILSMTSYLVYQNYDFFTAICKSTAAINVPALLNSIVAELILLISAAYTISRELKIKILAWTIMVGMICGLGVFMHASIDNDLTGNTDHVQALKQQRQDALKAKDSYEQEKEALDPMTWKSRRNALQAKINVERETIASLDKQIVEAKEVSTGNLHGIIIYNTILRIIAMVVNALLAHTLIRRIVKK